VTEFKLVGELSCVETIAVGRAIRDLARLRRAYGAAYWGKMKEQALIQLSNDRIRLAELHWYEAHAMGRKEFKRKNYLD
jgi:hypothetical protein